MMVEITRREPCDRRASFDSFIIVMEWGGGGYSKSAFSL